MAVVSEPTQVTKSCPRCEGDLVHEAGYWQCESCSHVPRHAAD